MVLILLLAVAAFALPTYERSLELQFRDFQKKFEKSYTVGTEEYAKRLKIFSANVAEAARLTGLEDGKGATFGVTKFMDLSPEEFQTTYLKYNKTGPRQGNAPTVDVSKVAPLDSKDWRNAAVVTNVRNQGVCGSCWAHATVESIESQCAIKGRGLTYYSVQQLVDCDTTDAGCNGGDTVSGFGWVESNGGLATESSYPYTSGRNGRTGTCKTSSHSGGSISGFTWAIDECYFGPCNNQDEDAMKSAVYQYGPPAICVNADEWQYYTGGVMTDRQCGSHKGLALNHCVQLVGYQNNYWMVRNSWDTDWGYDGYIHIEMGTNACGVADEVNFATCE